MAMATLPVGARHTWGYPNYPVLGRDAFRTGTGVHAAAIVKALHRGDVELADAVYSGVPAALVGRRQEIESAPWPATATSSTGSK